MRNVGFGICAFVLLSVLGGAAEAQLTITVTAQTNVSCNGGSNGSATVSVSGGSGNYEYLWSPAGGTAPTATGLVAGVYTVNVSDPTGGFFDSIDVTITQPTLLNATIVATNVSCNGGSNGVLAATPSGGTPGYTYAWLPAGGTAATATGLSAGSYTLVLTDANSCQRTFNNNIVTQPSAIVLTPSTQTNVACNGGATGAAATNNATGGVGGYSYNWTPGNPTGDGTTSVTGLSAGTWTNTVTDANGCTRSQVFNVTQPSVLVLNALSQTNVSCFGGSNGAASTGTASGGAGGYSYNWTPGNPTGDGTTSITGLSVGVYTNTVTDANGCSTPRSFTIVQPSAIVLNAASQTNIACNGGATGAASVTPATGGAGAFTYDWTPGTPAGDGTTGVTNLTAGTWTVTATDANGCTFPRAFTLSQPTLLTASTIQTNLACNAGNTGSAGVSVSGGTPSYTYLWSPTGATTSSISGLSAGAYSVTFTDANNCSANRNFTLTEPDALSLTPISTPVSCNGDADGTASVSVAGGTPPYAYDWNPVGGGTATITNLPAGSYDVDVSDANACTGTQSVTVTEPTELVASIPALTNVACFGGATGELTGELTGGTPPYSYAWAPSGGTTATINGLSAGTYTLVGTDAHDCTAAVNANLTQPAALVVALASMTQVSCGESDDGALTATVTGGAGGYVYDWTPGAPSGDGTSTISSLEVGSYTLTASDANECTASGTFDVTAAVGDNDLPTAIPSLVATLESTAVPITLTGADEDCDLLTFAIVTEPAHGELTGTLPNLTYTPTTGYSGPDSFTFTASDGTGTSAPATFTLNVTLVNAPPVGDAQSLTTDEGVAIVFTLTAVDPDDDELTFSIVDPPAHGQLSGTSPTLTYTPDDGYVGADSLTFVANDTHVDSAEVTVTLQIDAIPLPDAGVPDAAIVDAAPALPDALGATLPDARGTGGSLDDDGIESCGCRVGEDQGGTPWLLVALLLGPLALVTRRRRR